MLTFALDYQNKGPILKYNAMKVKQILCLFFMIISGCNVNRICAQKNQIGCLRGLSEEDKRQVILDRFEFMFLNNDY